MGPGENHYAILDEDRTSLALYILQGATSQEANEKKGANEKNGALDENSFTESNVASNQGPLQFSFETEVDSIFSSPLGGYLTYPFKYRKILSTQENFSLAQNNN